jgi:hypothetical protein
MPVARNNETNKPGFQGSETSSAEIIFYTQKGDPVVFVGANQERDERILADGRGRGSVNPSLLSLSTSKSMGAASGTWQAIMKPPGPSENLFDRILDDDWVDISFSRHGKKWHTMRGLVDQVHRTTVVSGSGATSEAFQITGRDWGKIFEVTPIWFSIFTDDVISGGVSYKVFGGQTNIQGDPGQTVEGFLRGFLEELAGTGRAVWEFPPTMPDALGNPTFVDNLHFDFERFSNDPPRIGINPNYLMPQGTVWEMAQEWSDPMFHELFVDTLPPFPEVNLANEFGLDDTLFTVVFRDRPFPSIEDGPNDETGQDSAWFSLPMHIIPRQAVANAEVGRAGMERFNAFFVAPQIAQEAVGAGAIDLYAPLWSPDDILRHGLRRFDVKSKYTSPKAELLTLSSRLRTRVRDWYCINPYLLSGTIALGIGMPNIHIGNRIRIPGTQGPDFDETYYVESVSNRWQFGPGMRTEMGVTRGWIGTDDSYLDALGLIAGNYEVAIKRTSE